MNHWEIINNGLIVSSDTPEELWENACSYFKYCDDNPIIIKRVITSGKEVGRRVLGEQHRPYSIKGLCLHCGILEEYLRDVRASKETDSLFFIVIAKILYIIYVQNLEMAMIGEFNPIFTAKVLNMEKEEVPQGTITVSIVAGLPELSNSENEILEKMNLENEIKLMEQRGKS